MAITGTAIGISALVNTITAICSLAGFTVLINIPWTKRFYAPKAPQGKQLFIPYLSTFKKPLEDIAKDSGVDAAVHILMMRVCLQIFAVLTVLCCGVLIPVNVTDDYITTLNEQGGSYTDVETTYMTNITPQSPRMWAHLGMVYVVSIVIALYMWVSGYKVKYLRHKYPKINKSVLLTDIPKNEGLDIIKPMLPPFTVTQVHMQTREVRKLYKEYKKLEHKNAHISDTPTDKPHQFKLRPSKYGTWGTDHFGLSTKMVNTVDFNVARMQYLREQINNAQKVPAQAAFLTFSTHTDAVLVSKAIYEDNRTWRFHAAPSLDDIIFKNVVKSKTRREILSYSALALFVVLLLVYIPLCAAIQAMLQFDQLADQVPIFNTIAQMPFVAGLLQAILPSLVLTIFLLFVPAIIMALNRFSGMQTVFNVDSGLAVRFYIFNFFATFLATVIGGTALDQMSALLNDPTQFIQIFASSLPTTASFFITFILMGGVGLASIGFLRIIGISIFSVRMLLTKSQRAKDALWQNQKIMFGGAMTAHTSIFMLGIVFCCQAPIITVACLYYFALNMFYERYKVIYVFDKVYESNGVLWSVAFGQMMTAVYIFQVMMLLQLGFKGFVFAPIIIPAIFATAVFHATTNKFMRNSWTENSLKIAHKCDVDPAYQSNDHFVPEIFDLGMVPSAPKQETLPKQEMV